MDAASTPGVARTFGFPVANANGTSAGKAGGLGFGNGLANNGSAHKRKRSGGGFDSSPGSGGDEVDAEGAEGRRQPGVKRACNECRQQKVSQAFYRVIVIGID